MPFPTVNLLYNLQPGAEESPLSDGGKFSLISLYSKIGYVMAAAPAGYRPQSTNPQVRSTIETKTASGTSLNLSQPGGTANGDLLVVFITCQPGEAIPTITAPTGQGWVKIGTLGEATEAGSKRSFGIWYTKVGEGAGEVKVGAEMKWSCSVSSKIIAFTSAIQTLTYNATEPIDAEGSWVKAAASNNPAIPQITAIMAETRAVACIDSGSGTPKEPTGEYIAAETSGVESLFSSPVGAAGLTPEATYKKTGTKECWALVFTVKPNNGDAAYWNPETFKSPAVAATINQVVDSGRTFRLFACLASPNTTEPNGYLVRAITQSGNVNAKYEIFKLVKGVATLLVASSAVTRPAAGDKFGVTVQSGVITAWRKVGAGAWTVVTEASDSTYTEGYVGLGMNAGITGRLINFEAIAQVHEHTLETTQAQSPSKVVALAKALAASNAQVATRTAAISKTLTPSAATQVISRVTTPTRVLTKTQGQTISRTTSPSRNLTSSVTQVVSKPTAALTRTLSAAASSVASRIAALARTLTTSQGQTASKKEELIRPEPTTQGQTATLSKVVSRALSTTQGQTVTMIRRPTRTLTTSQPQVATMTETIQKGSVTFKETLSTTQGQTPTLRKTVSRTLTTSQASSPTLARSLTHTFTAASATVATLRKALSRSLTATASQSCSLVRVGAHNLPTAQTSTANLARAVSRTLRTSTVQIITLEGGTIEVPLPPPVKMSASTSGDMLHSSTGGHDRLTSSARTP